MATKYISLEAAIALTDQHCFESGYDAEWMEAELKCIPAADVRPVVRGRWIEVSRPTQSKKAAICECSVCGDTIWVYDGQREWKYCPNCGSDMREVVEIDQVKEGAE